MTVAELKNMLSKYDDNEQILFYYLKDNIVTNAIFEDINSYGMGIEFTVQDTYDGIESTMFQEKS